MVQTRKFGSENDNFKAFKTGGFLGFGKKFDNWDIDGGAGSDTLTGGDKRDSLRGGTGGDSLLGGKGDDRYFVDRSADIIVEKSGQGNDVVFSKAPTFVLPNHVEILDIDEPNLSRANAFGNSLDNNIYGADTTQEDFISGLGGNDGLFGFANQDTLEGGSGNDTLEGGSGDDTLKGSDKSVTSGEEVDVLTGGTGADLLILGYKRRSQFSPRDNKFYDNAGNSDFARIKDFDLGTDKLELAGIRSDYQVSEVSGEVRLFAGSDLIAIFEQNSAISISAALNSSDTTTFLD